MNSQDINTILKSQECNNFEFVNSYCERLGIEPPTPLKCLKMHLKKNISRTFDSLLEKGENDLARSLVNMYTKDAINSIHDYVANEVLESCGYDQDCEDDYASDIRGSLEIYMEKDYCDEYIVLQVIGNLEGTYVNMDMDELKKHALRCKRYIVYSYVKRLSIDKGVPIVFPHLVNRISECHQLLEQFFSREFYITLESYNKKKYLYDILMNM